MKILLTGGSGFIGKNILEGLSSKYNFVAPTHLELDILNTEAVLEFLKQEKFNIVIHTANIGGARNSGNLAGVFEANKKMFLNLAENRALFQRMIFLGSGAEYGKQLPIVNVSESDFGKVKPEDEYGQAKYFASEYIAKAENIVNLRLFGVFGKYEDFSIRFISNAIVRALKGLPITINQNVKFSYIYINDLVKIIDYFIEHTPKEKFYNVGGEKHVEILELAKLVKNVTGIGEEIEVKNSGLGKEYTANSTLLESELGSFSFTPTEQAITELTSWYKDNINNINL